MIQLPDGRQGNKLPLLVWESLPVFLNNWNWYLWSIIKFTRTKVICFGHAFLRFEFSVNLEKESLTFRSKNKKRERKLKKKKKLKKNLSLIVQGTKARANKDTGHSFNFLEMKAFCVFSGFTWKIKIIRQTTPRQEQRWACLFGCYYVLVSFSI